MVTRSQVIQELAYLTAAGLMDRCEIVGVDFFKSVPGGADAYVLKRILHDWGDERSVQILHVCREAMGENARILVVDAVVPPGNEPHPSKIMDILMMVGFEGQERTEFVWHHHENEDELFLVVKGRLRMKLRDREVTINEGEFFIVPRGVEHLPIAEEEVHVVLLEPASTLNTGNVRNERTVEKLERV